MRLKGTGRELLAQEEYIKAMLGGTNVFVEVKIDGVVHYPSSWEELKSLLEANADKEIEIEITRKPKAG